MTAGRGSPDPAPTPLTDRDALTRLLAEAQQLQAGAFLQALRGVCRDLPLDERDDRLLRWLAGWDSETVAGVIRLLRLMQERNGPHLPTEAPAALTDLDTLSNDELATVIHDLREVMDRHVDEAGPVLRYLFMVTAAPMEEYNRRRDALADSAAT